MIAREKMTVADFEALLALPENAHKRLELLNGELCEMTPASQLSGVITVRLSARLQLFIEENKLGLLTSPENGFQLSPVDLLVPDAAFIAKGRLQGVRKRGFFQIAPDLAIEVVSPSDSIPAVQRKAARHLALGVREVWIIYPDDQTADIYRAGNAPNRLEVQQIASDGALESDLLPEFRLPLPQLFALGAPILDDRPEDAQPE